MLVLYEVHSLHLAEKTAVECCCKAISFRKLESILISFIFWAYHLYQAY